MVEALQSSSQRAYLKLSMELLKEAIAVNGDESRLVAYAEANVVFKEKVPHEWLLKRVACTVHHGGAGTLRAALSGEVSYPRKRRNGGCPDANQGQTAKEQAGAA